MIVLSWSRATRDLLKSFGWGIGALHQLATATMVPFPRRLPHSISSLEQSGFEPSVPRPGLSSIRAVRAEIIGRSTDVFRRSSRSATGEMVFETRAVHSFQSVLKAGVVLVKSTRQDAHAADEFAH